MKKTIPISELAVGMFVESVVMPETSKESARVTKRGVVRSQELIKQLIAAGVKKVIINDSSEAQESNNSLDVPVQNKSDDTKPKRAKAGLSDARRIYKRAKELQLKTVSALREDRTIDVSVISDMSDALLDSFFSDQDAMLCASMMRSKDDYLLEHSINVSLLLAAFAKYLDMPMEKIRAISLGGFLHDIGKVKVPDEILQKPGRLTDQEYLEMKRHVDYGVEALANLKSLPKEALAVVAEHHEKVDGTGYPKQLKSESISLIGKMAAIADCYDAITASRVYKNGIVSSKAFKILLNEAGSHFELDLVVKFINALGVYPVGSLVLLSNGRVGLVVRSNKSNPLEPVIKTFYSYQNRHFTEIKELDLSSSHVHETIERNIGEDELDIDLTRFFDEFIID